MNQLKTFAYIWKNSFSSVEYYKDVIKAPFSFSLKYFLFFSLLLSLAVTVFFVAKLFSPVNNFLTRFPQVLVKAYPEELQIKITKGVVTTNVQEPYFIPIDRLETTFQEFDRQVQGLKSDQIENLMVIDTAATAEDLARYQTYALLTKNNLIYYKDDGRIEVVSLDNINDFTVNQGFIQGTVNRILPFLRILGVMLIPFVLAGSLVFFSLFQLSYLLVVAFVLFLVAKLISVPVAFSKAYQIDLHVATIIIPFFLLLSLFKIELQFPFLKLIVFTLIGLYILNNLKKDPRFLTKAKKSGKRS